MAIAPFAVCLSLCFFASGVLLYLRQKRASIGLCNASKWLQPGSDAVSDCEKGGIEPSRMFEVCEKTRGSEATKVLPLGVTQYPRDLGVRTTRETACVKEIILVDASAKAAGSLTAQHLMAVNNEYQSLVDPMASRHVLPPTVPETTPDPEQPSLQPLEYPSHQNFDFDSFVKDADEIPISRPSAPMSRRPGLPLARKSKRSWGISDLADVNFGSMQVKGIREVREDRPKQEY